MNEKRINIAQLRRISRTSKARTNIINATPGNLGIRKGAKPESIFGTTEERFQADITAVGKILFFERLLSQQHVLKRQLIQNKNTNGNGCHKIFNTFFGNTIYPISEKQTRNTTISIQQDLSIFERPLSHNTWLDNGLKTKQQRKWFSLKIFFFGITKTPISEKQTRNKTTSIKQAFSIYQCFAKPTTLG